MSDLHFREPILKFSTTKICANHPSLFSSSRWDSSTLHSSAPSRPSERPASPRGRPSPRPTTTGTTTPTCCPPLQILHHPPTAAAATRRSGSSSSARDGRPSRPCASAPPPHKDIVVVSPQPHFLYTPLLAGSAVGTITLRSACEPLRALVEHAATRASSATFVRADARDIDVENKTVRATMGGGSSDELQLSYDKLIVAVGARFRAKLRNPIGDCVIMDAIATPN